MTAYVLTAETRSDYFDASDFIASNSAKAALRWESKILEAFDHLSEWPHTGHLRPEFASELIRFWVEGDYLVIYDPHAAPIAIIGILHGAQDLLGLIAAVSNTT